jgi:hypothetical protein
MKLEPDGSFRIDDVEPGIYTLLIVVRERPTDQSHPAIGGDELGRVQREVTVPPIPGGRSDEPLDLGSTTLEPVRKPDAGPPEPVRR